RCWSGENPSQPSAAAAALPSPCASPAAPFPSVAWMLLGMPWGSLLPAVGGGNLVAVGPASQGESSAVFYWGGRVNPRHPNDPSRRPHACPPQGTRRKSRLHALTGKDHDLIPDPLRARGGLDEPQGLPLGPELGAQGAGAPAPQQRAELRIHHQQPVIEGPASHPVDQHRRTIREGVAVAIL